jgi:hypothetical protein
MKPGMDNTADILDNVLRKIILPKFDEILEVRVTQLGLGPHFYVIYYYDKNLSRKTVYESTTDTVTLFRMINSEEGGDIILDYVSIDQLKKETEDERP